LGGVELFSTRIPSASITENPYSNKLTLLFGSVAILKFFLVPAFHYPHVEVRDLSDTIVDFKIVIVGHDRGVCEDNFSTPVFFEHDSDFRHLVFLLFRNTEPRDYPTEQQYKNRRKAAEQR
jgi:hypothetical protein